MSKSVVVTGSKGGVGGQLCRDLLDKGYQVTGFDRNPADIKDAAWPVIKCDMSDCQSIESAFNELVSKAGAPYALVNNAGAYFAKTWQEESIEEFDYTLAVNIRGPFYLSRHFACAAIEAGKPGVIVNVSSVSGTIGSIDVAYAASKAGLTAVSKSLAKAFAPSGIRVVTVSPGPIETRMAGKIPPERKKAYMETIPLKRFAEPREISAAIIFLLSEEASYITGTEYRVDAGLV